HRRHIGGSQYTSHQSQVDAGREERIYKADDITHEDVAVAHHFIGDVGPISDDKGTIGELRLTEHLRCAQCLRHLIHQEAERTSATNALLASTAVDHGSCTGPTCMQWNVPEPAVRVRLDKNIRVIKCRQTLRSGKIAVHCQILKKGIPAAQLQLM